MSKGVAIVYLFWSLILLAAGYHIFNKMMDSNDPNSLKSNFQKLEKTINDEDLQ